MRCNAVVGINYRIEKQRRKRVSKTISQLIARVEGESERSSKLVKLISYDVVYKCL